MGGVDEGFGTGVGLGLGLAVGYSFVKGIEDHRKKYNSPPRKRVSKRVTRRKTKRSKSAKYK